MTHSENQAPAEGAPTCDGCGKTIADHDALLRCKPQLKAELEPLTKRRLDAVLQELAESIESYNIVMTHWPEVARAVERAHGIGAKPPLASKAQPKGTVVAAWQPMKTAPKDGTAILVLLEGSDVPHAVRWDCAHDHGWLMTWDNHRLSAADGPRYWTPCPADPDEPGAAPSPAPAPEPYGYLRQTSSAANPPHGWAFHFAGRPGDVAVYLKAPAPAPVARMVETSVGADVFVHGIKVPDFPIGTAHNDRRAAFVAAVNAAARAPAVKAELKPLTKRRLDALLQELAESIDSYNIVMTHWPEVARAVERAHGIGFDVPVQGSEP